MKLTDRQLAALRYAAAGLTNVQIGAAMHLSATVAKCHLHDTYRRLGARNRAHAVAIGYDRGLLKPGASRSGAS